MANSSVLKIIDVLLVEDDPGDVLLTTEALERSSMPNQLHVMQDGEEAIHFLRQVGGFAGASRPGLILLDLNLPRRNGLEVLNELKNDPDLQTNPLVVLTTSPAQQDILSSYRLHANAYITKPGTFDHFIEANGKVDQFFFALVQLPTRSEAQ